MTKKSSPKLEWLSEPEEHDYPAAASYLTLHYEAKEVEGLIKKLQQAPISSFKAKDIFRSSGLSLLGVSNSHVEGNLKKVKKGKALSPLLLVRRNNGGNLIIADGYHRLCAMYALSEDILVPCKIV